MSELEPITTLSGDRKSSTALPCFKNSGFDTTSNGYVVFCFIISVTRSAVPTGTVDLSTMTELPEFARRYLVKELRETCASNMTLWKNVLLSAIYLYTVLGNIPRYSSDQEVSEKEKNAFINLYLA